jgi:hypothetical protein
MGFIIWVSIEDVVGKEEHAQRQMLVFCAC